MQFQAIKNVYIYSKGNYGENMYWHCCYHDNNMNWLMGLGMLFGALGRIMSDRRMPDYYPNMPIFSYTPYSSYPSYDYPQASTNNSFLVGNTLAGINTEEIGTYNYNSSESIFNAIPNTPPPQQDYSLVGNTLTSINPSDYNSSYTNLYTSLGENPEYVNPYAQLNSYIPSTTTPSESIQVAQPPSHIGKDDTIIRNGEYVKISKDIEGRIKQIAAKLNCDYRDLIGMIWAESRFDKNAWNGTTAVGLIQFTQICITDLNQNYGLNLTKQKIARMSVFQQLDLAEKSLIRSKEVAGLPPSHRLSAAELYTINFLPGRLKSHANKGYLTKRGENFYAQNRGADINRDNYITKEELSQFIRQGRKYVTTIA